MFEKLKRAVKRNSDKNVKEKSVKNMKNTINIILKFKQNRHFIANCLVGIGGLLTANGLTMVILGLVFKIS